MLFPVCASPSACKDFSDPSYSHHDCNLLSMVKKKKPQNKCLIANKLYMEKL